MATTKFISERNLRFLLYEVFDLESLTDYPYYQEYNRKMFDMVLDAAVKLSKDLMWPILEEMDAKQRSQGRNLSQKDPALAAVAIIEHADVKRMLLFQRSVVEGALALLLQSAKYADLEKVSTGGKKEKYALLLDILTPVAKSYPSEMGILSVSLGLQ